MRMMSHAYFRKHSRTHRLDTLGSLTSCFRYLPSKNDTRSFFSVVYRPKLWRNIKLRDTLLKCIPYVGYDLFFRAVSSQVFSALQSLTSVFGMGTGGPFALRTLTLSESCSQKTE